MTTGLSTLNASQGLGDLGSRSSLICQDGGSVRGSFVLEQDSFLP